MPSLTSRSLLNTFSEALRAFTSSSTPFAVLRTIPPTSQPPTHHHPRRLIILDSSFNPPTAAHLAMVLSALRHHSPSVGSSSSSAAKVLLLLSVENADKKPKPASFAHRLCMMERMASEVHSALQVAVDVGVTNKPYFHDKSAVVAASGRYENAEQIFLAGYDTLIRVLNPKYYPSGMRASLDPFFERARLRVVLRAGGDWGTVEEQRSWVEGLRQGGEDWGGSRAWLRDRVDLVDGLGDGVSSSQVREMIEAGEEGWQDMVPKAVGEYIRDEGLYADEGTQTHEST